jgi:1-acyl-sn-glycerol-3-phosphate acyltransferase
VIGRFLEAMGAFPVNRSSADRSALNHAEEVLRAGQALVLFPEGTRKDGPFVAELLEGAAFLSARTGAPIVPVGIGGSAKAMPKGAKLPRPTRIVLHVGEPIAPPVKNEKGRVPRSVVHETTERLRREIQDCFDRASA